MFTRRLNKFCGKAVLNGRGLRKVNFSSNVPDAVLQKSVGGLVDRAILALNYFTVPAERKRFERIRANFIDVPMRLAFLWKVFTDFQNPLLKKYSFDGEDFAVGAKESFSQFYSVLSAPETMLSVKDNSISDEGNFLRETTSPLFYQICTNAFKTMVEKNLGVTLVGIDVQKMNISGISTYIEDANNSERRHAAIFFNQDRIVEKLTEFLCYPAKVQASKSFNIGFIHVEVDSAPTTDKEEIKREVEKNLEKEEERRKRFQNNDMNQLTYVNGSVIALIDVLCQATTTFKPDKESGDVDKRTSVTRLTFSGCISGQTELEWKLISFGDISADVLRLLDRQAKAKEISKV